MSYFSVTPISSKSNSFISSFFHYFPPPFVFSSIRFLSLILFSVSVIFSNSCLVITFLFTPIPNARRFLLFFSGI